MTFVTGWTANAFTCEHNGQRDPQHRDPHPPYLFWFIPSLDSPSSSDHINGLKTLSLSLQLLTLYRNIPEFSFKKEGPKLYIELGPFF